MSLKRHLMRVARTTFRKFGYTIRAGSGYGIDPLFDIKRLSDKWHVQISTVFDVGANDGSVCKELRDCFPSARIFAFEPHPQTYACLLENCSLQDFYPHNCALSSKDGLAEFFVYPNSKLNSLEPNASYTSMGTVRPMKIAVKTTTIDRICRDNEVDEIGILKIDTEGHDLEVLRGANNILSEGGVKFIIAEFNDVQFKSRTGALMSIDDFLGRFGFRFMAAYTESVIPEGVGLSVSNALFGLRPCQK